MRVSLSSHRCRRPSFYRIIGHVLSIYNVQISVYDKHKLIVASEVVNDGNDTSQLYEMSKAAKESLVV